MSSPTSRRRLIEAKRRAQQSVMPIDGVQGVGIGDRTIRIYIRDETVKRSLPDEVDDFPVEPVVVGEITAD